MEGLARTVMRWRLTRRDPHGARGKPRRVRIEDANLYRLTASAAQIEFFLHVLAQVITELWRHVLHGERGLQRFEDKCVTSV